MKIDGHPTEIEAMRLFHCGENEKASSIQDKFISELHETMNNKEDYCSCKNPCKFHGKCVECVAIHRGHRDHLPDCFKDMVNEKFRAMSALTEHSIVVMS